MKIAIAGASGFVGTRLSELLAAEGHIVVRLVRRESRDDHEISWNPAHEKIIAKHLEGMDTVINLSGENISAGRWNKDLKEKIVSSRLESTRTLVTAFKELKQKPRVFINASAVGCYGNRKDEELNEESPLGSGFLAELCQKWEAEAQKAAPLGIRSVQLRLGIVLSPEAGALQKMLTPFRLGIGGVLGPGTQYMSWISIDDLLKIFLHVIANEKIGGALNAVSPHPVTAREFATTLAKTLNRPLGPRVPAFVLKMIAGEMAEELMLASIRAYPRKLEELGFQFQYPELNQALAHLLTKSSS